ncbi:Hypothetical predicted protein [Olea europaea subsp. europaea]|uniref:Uncharacterized protein n=1 Tax=Olea europaea subsp. europaea TaxID=158383 RepID=A0A8S0T943_OLEEU|nr:Hypothetical predicted protein [Olea europaea subsp. europaea]
MKMSTIPNAVFLSDNSAGWYFGEETTFKEKNQKTLASLILPKVAMDRVTEGDRCGSVSEILKPDASKEGSTSSTPFCPNDALNLCQNIIRATEFIRCPRRDVLTENARKEFEDARFEKDLEIVALLLIGGQDVCSRLLISLSRSKSSKLRMKAMNQIDVDVFW